MLLSLTGRRWIDRAAEASPTSDPILDRLLAIRGIRTPEETDAFYRAGLELLHDPFLLPDMQRAAELVAGAARSGARIGIFGDYDADGQTGTALLARVLRRFGAEPCTYIPHRIDEGYGLNQSALGNLLDQDVALIITVDCGITDVDEARWLNDQNIPLIITDHHMPQDQLPPAAAIINPRLAPDYPCADLAGVGVAFKLAEAVSLLMTGERHIAHEYVDLVAVGTIADVVPLTDENRSLVRAGLERMNAGEATAGLAALAEVAGLDSTITAGHVAFRLAPRLNAAGRIADPSIGVQLLLADSAEQSLPLARILHEENETRRRIEETIVREASAQAEEVYDPASDKGLIIAGEDWHPGVIGIVASRLVDRYHCPVIVLSIDGETARGSARSIPPFDVHAALTQCADLFDTFGGHKAAAGLTLPKRNIAEFNRRFLAIAEDTLTEEDLVPSISIDIEAELKDINPATIEAFADWEPFGIANPAPVIVSRNVQARVLPLGKSGQHVRLMLREKGMDGTFDAVGFGLATVLTDRVDDDTWIDVAFTPEVNEWQGRRQPRLRLRDVRLAAAEHAPAAEYTAAFLRADPPVLIERGADGDLDPDVAVRIQDIQVIDGRNHDKLAAVTKLLDRGRPTYALCGSHSAIIDGARTVANASVRLKERLVPLGRGTTLEASVMARAQAALSGPPWLCLVDEHWLPGSDDALGRVIADIAARHGLTVVVWTAPMDPRDLVRHVDALRRWTDDLDVVLLYGSDEGQRLRQSIHAHYPDRDVLRRLYVVFQEARVFERSSRQLAKLARRVRDRWSIEVSVDTVRSALTTFHQLDLVQIQPDGITVRDNPSKVDLADAVRYNKGISVRNNLDDYVRVLLEAGTAEFWERMLQSPRFASKGEHLFGHRHTGHGA